MPAWWRGRSKSKSKPSSPPRKSQEEVFAPAPPGQKAKSFDGLLLPRSPNGCPLGHRLPLPCELLQDDLADPSVRSVAGSLSGSSVSSSASSDETPELRLFRHSSEPISTPRDRNVKFDVLGLQHVAEESRTFTCSPISEHADCYSAPISPRKECFLHAIDQPSNGTALALGWTSKDTIYNPRSANNASSLRVHAFHAPPTSPIHHGAFSICPESPTVRQDDMRSSPHPLPLPPRSPSSSASCSPQSHWKKGKLLGKGSFGCVYQGFNSEGGQMCAIKEVTVISDDTNSEECLRQLNQEISLLSQLSHPNIVQYYGSKLVDDTLSVYLEYVSGGSIHKLLQEYGSFKEPLIRNYTRQILSGLAYLHERNTVHRDIKGANILVDPNGEIKLGDFGMAKHIAAYTSLQSFRGSPYWMAPEVIMNGSGYNLSVDIWSLGCTIIEMATSKPPWSQYEGVPAIFKIASSKDLPEIPDHFSEEGTKFLQLCLQRDPTARPTAAQLLDHPFVRDQTTAKARKPNMFRETMLSPAGGSHTTATRGASSRSVSPYCDRDYGVRQTSGFPSAFRASDLMRMRTNMSLPVSPCSSPLRQFKQKNKSCLPSPPHPSYSTGAINFGPNNYSLYPKRSRDIFLDPWHDIQLNLPTAYGSPPKSMTPYDSPLKSATSYESPRRCL